MLSDWLKKLVPLSQPIRNKTKTNLDLLACIFLPWTLILVFASICDWLILFFVPVVIG